MTFAGRGLPPGPALWARADLRRRWKALVVLGVLAGLSAGLALAALAGARRTDTAFSRLRTDTAAADAVVFATQVGITDPDWSKLEAQPYVAQVARWNLLFGSSKDLPELFLLFGPSDRALLHDTDRPLLLEGRMYSLDAPDEVVVDEGVTGPGTSVGSTFTYQFFAPDQDDTSGEPPAGPTVRFRIVGRVRTASTLLFTDGQVMPSPALLKTYGSNIAALENAHVRVRNPATDMDRLRRDAPNLVGPAVPVLDLHQVETRVSTAITVERTALLLLAAAVAAAALVFVGQALARSVSIVGEDEAALRALGMTARDVSTAAIVPHLVSIGCAVVVTFATAVALSPRFPIGFAATVDPDRGVHLDWTVLGPGLVLTALIMMLGAVLATRRQRRRIAPTSRATLASAVRRVTPLPVGLGATMALATRRGRRVVPVRPALAGAAVAVLGLVGALMLRHGLDDAVSHPERVGVTWNAAVEPGSSVLDPGTPTQVSPAYLQKVTTSPGVDDVTVLWRGVLDVNGRGVPVVGPERVRGDISLVTVEGRAPQSAAEVALGPETADKLGVDVGGEVRIADRTFRVVGIALFPDEVHSAFTEGVWADAATLLALAPPNTAEQSGAYPNFAVRWAPGADPEASLAALQEHLGDSAASVAAAVIPRELTNLRRVRSVPTALAVFLLLLAVTTLAHALVSTVRLRRGEFAVLRALGFTRRMGAGVVRTHGTTVALVGLLVGVPLGIVVGRLGWSWVASRVPLVYAPPLTLAIVLIIPLALVVANLVAAWPARRAARLRAADVLRTE